MTASRFSLFVFAVLSAGLLCSTQADAQQKYGTVTGKFVLDGDVPDRVFLIKNGKLARSGQIPKNPEVCAVADLKSDELIVDPKGKGIGNVFVYLGKAPATVHPDLKDAPKEAVKFDQEQCRFIPHALFVRTGQPVLVLSRDNCSHNLHTYPLLNEAENFIVTPKFRKGRPLAHENPEPLPMKVGCDLHPWMSAYWLILDHSYAAVSVAEPAKKKGKEADSSVIGTFVIDKIPYGDYEFRVWHEAAGYMGFDTKRGIQVKVDKPKVELEPFKAPAKWFE